MAVAPPVTVMVKSSVEPEPIEEQPCVLSIRTIVLLERTLIRVAPLIAPAGTAKLTVAVVKAVTPTFTAVNSVVSNGSLGRLGPKWYI